MDNSVENRPKRQRRDSYDEIQEILNLYAPVDKKQCKVLARQDDNCIRDDDRSGYVEYARDSFDDYLDSISIASTSKKGKSPKMKKTVSENAGKENMHPMLFNMPAKKDTLSDDKVLRKLLAEIEETPTNSLVIRPKPFRIQLKKKSTAKPTAPQSSCIINSEKVFRFFWWDAYENIVAEPGVVLLFGKTYSETAESYISCCVAVRDIQRRIFVLPRPYVEDSSEDEPVTYQNLRNEFCNEVMEPLKITNFQSRYLGKKYAFSPEIPRESNYMEVRYSANDPEIESTKTGKTFSKIFGIRTSYLEILLLEQKIKGPCWLDISNSIPSKNPVTWCKSEVNCYKLSDVVVSQLLNPLPPPPLIVAAVNIRCAMSPRNCSNEIVMISCLVHNKYAVNKEAPDPPFQKQFCDFLV